MQNLLQIILRYGGFFSFLLLESICIYLLVTYNTSQREIYLYSSNLASGQLLNTMHEVKAYADLKSLNDSLSAENARLKAKVLALSKDSLALTDTSSTYDIIACEVINNNIGSRNNMMTLNKGKASGLHKSMGIIDDKGIVGIIKRAGNHFSTAYSILNTDLRISARIKRNNYFGTLSWPAESTRQMVLRSIPKHADVRIGDTVVTSSFSTIFPPDIPIGIVENVTLQPGRSDFKVDVKLLNELANARVVYAVRLKDAPMRLQVENEDNDE